jgi:hypothetical protein
MGGLTRPTAVASALLALIIAAAFCGSPCATCATPRPARRQSEQVLAASNALERLLLDLETH